MRIAMVSEHASPLAVLGGADGGGQNVHVDALARALAARGHEVVVHTRRDDPALPATVTLAPGVTVHHVDAGPAVPIPKDALLPHLPQFTAELERHWRRTSPDVAHAHFWMSGLAAAPAAAALQVPLALTFHALGTVKRRHQGAADTSPPARLDAERALALTAARVIATAQEEVRELAVMGVPASQVAVVPCGVDTRRFSPMGRTTRGGPGPVQLLCLGRLVPRKGVDDAIAMLRWLPDCELVVAGGPAVDELDADPEVHRLRAVADRVGASDRVRFVGAVARPDVPDLIRAADAVVCLPWYEQVGIVPLEAMACGRPVVGAAVGGLLDTVEDGVTGLLVPPRSPRSAAAAVRRLVADPALRRDLGQRARQAVVARYDWSRVATATEGVYALLTPAGRGDPVGLGATGSTAAVVPAAAAGTARPSRWSGGRR